MKTGVSDDDRERGNERPEQGRGGARARLQFVGGAPGEPDGAVEREHGEGCDAD